MKQVRWAVVGFFVNEYNWLDSLLIEDCFDNIQEAEAYRADFLKDYTESNPQNVQVIQYEYDNDRNP